MKLKLKKGDCIEKMGELEESSVSSILCDPPYGLEFIAELEGRSRNLMNPTSEADIKRKEDYGNSYAGRTSNLPDLGKFGQYGKEVQEWHKGWVGACHRVLSEEGVLMAFNSSKTTHRMIAAMVEVDFHVSMDSWVYLSGMPKASRDLGAGVGWHTNLKPSYEPVIVCRKQKGESMHKSHLIYIGRKPLSEKNIAENVLKHGTGAMNIDACRISAEDTSTEEALDEKGRWPANSIFSSSCAKILTKQIGAEASTYFFTTEDRKEPLNPYNKSKEGFMIPQDLIDYLHTMITPTHIGGECLIVLEDLNNHDLTQYTDSQWHGCIAVGTPTEETSKELMRVMRAGAHLMLIAPEEEPTGYKGACQIEDTGFEIRDSIFWARETDPENPNFMYMPKASRSERELGTEHLKKISGAEAVDRKEDSAGMNNPRAGAGRTAKEIGNFHPCLHPRAEVLTDKGYRPIEEINIGDKVYSADGKFHEVEHVSRHPYTSKNLYEIAVKGTNYTTLSSDNHPFLMYRPTRTKKGGIKGGDVLWLRGDQIQKGDYAMTPKFVDVSSDLQKRENISVEEYEKFFAMGLWVAEGVAQKAGHGKNVYPSWTLHQDETEYLELIKRTFSDVNVSVYPKKGSKAVQVMAFCPKRGAEYVELFGKGASTKCLPTEIWGYSEPIRKAILDGYLAGDGGKVRTYIQAKTVSPDLASQMRLLAHSVGYRANLFQYPAVEGKGIGNRKFKTTLPTYQLRLYSDNLKADRTRKPSRPATIMFEGHEYSLSYVKSVTEVPYVGDVVNLSVEGSPTFQTAIGMSHNTVKPIGIMEWLARDVPKGATVLDPFMGSGTMGIACVKTGHSYIGTEIDADYFPIADARIKHWNNTYCAWNSGEVISDLDEEASESEEIPTIDLNSFLGF